MQHGLRYDMFLFLRARPACNFRSAVSSLGRFVQPAAQVARLDEKEVEKEPQWDHSRWLYRLYIAATRHTV